ncbi:IS256 family transposase [Azospirillum brasilense]|nr:IS256 family transposase [Azospirillum brasilense]
MAGQAGLFDLQDRYAELSKSGDPLERLLSVVDFEVFRPTLDAALGRKDRSRGGRPPLDAVMMFKILVLQALYGLSDEQAEYQVRDRLSFMRFLGLGLGDRVPDRTTIWLFREALVTAGAMEGLFARFDADLKERGYFALGGQIIDASIVEAPRQRLTREEKRQIRDGEDPPWPPAKARQKDTQARWTVKRGRVKAKPGPTLDGSEARMVEGLLIPAFGYKSHITIDRRFRLIRRFIVTDAARHDGAQLGTSEAETFWTEFLRKLKRRGLAGVKLVISDAHEGIKAAVSKVFRATWQRCRVHFMRNALAHAGRSGRRVVSAFIATAFAQDNAGAAKAQWRQVADQVRPKLPKLAALLDEAGEDVLAFMTFPKEHRAKIHSTNPLERLNGEIKRRTEIVGIFPNEAAITRLIGAILLEQNDEWAVQRARYMTLETIAPLRDDLVLTLPTAATWPSRPDLPETR